MATLDPEKRSPARASAVILALFAMGVYGMTGQIILVRELLVIFYGSELSLGLIFACWLLWISAGAALAARMIPRLRDPGRWLSWALVCALICLPAQVSLVRVLRGILGTAPGLLIPLGQTALATVLVLLPVSFLIGFTFPLGAALCPAGSSGKARSIGTVYVAETLGSVVGATIFTVLLAGRVNPFPSLGIAALPLLAACVILDRAGSGTGRGAARWTVTGLAALTVLVLLTGCGGWLDRETIKLRWKSAHPGINLVEWRDSRYQHLSAGALAGQTTLYGNGAPIVSLPDEYDAAVAAHLLLVEQPRPRRVLLLGGGTSEMLLEILKHPVERLDYVETDPELIDLTRTYSSPGRGLVFADPRLGIHAVDGRAFLKMTDAHYDLVIARLPDPSTAMLNRFYTVEFFREVAARLEPDGTFAFSVGGAVNYMGEEVGPFRATLFRSLSRVFPHVIVTPGERNFFIASRSADAITQDPEELAARYETRGVKSDYFFPFLYSEIFQPERTLWFRREMEEVPTSDLNTDGRPVSYFQTVLLWDRFSGSHIGSALKRVAGLRLWMVAAALAVLTTLRLLWLRVHAPSRRFPEIFNALSTIATTGFLAMGIQMLVLFAFQNQLGYIYEKVGLVVATFMLGLFSGGRIGSVLASRSLPPRRVLQIVDAAIVILCLALPGLLGAPAALGRAVYGPAAEVWFFFLSGSSGFLAGIQFPLAGRLYLEHRREVARAAGQVDGADHLGAAVGALVVGSLLVPLLGIVSTCAIMAGLKAANLVLLLLPSRAAPRMGEWANGR